MESALIIGAKPLPDEFESRVWEIARQGGVNEEYATLCVKWFYIYLETRKATESAKSAGFNNSQLSWKGNQLVKKFRPLITEALALGLIGGEPLAMQRLLDVAGESYMVPLTAKDGDGRVVLVKDDDGKRVMVADPKMAAVVVKASAEILNRGNLPNRKTMDVSITDQRQEVERDWRELLKELVRGFGREVVLSKLGDRPDMRAFIEQTFPVKVVNE